ncbi:glutathione peroxidase [Roseibium sp. M-1]
MTWLDTLPHFFTSAMKAAALAAVAILACPFAPAMAEDKGNVTAHSFTFDMPYGEPLALNDFAGKAVLLVNTATECGFSGQLSGLQRLHETYGGKGLVVIGVPSNDFGGQEPRADGEIAKFCESKYGAEFLMTSKTTVKGQTAHPFYKWAIETLGPTARPYWNFHKYLIGPDGHIKAWFPTPVPPMSPEMTSGIEAQLAGM